MTLDEAKKEIKAQADAQWEEFKKTGSSLCQGFALGGNDALEILDEVDTEPVGISDKMTLRELAQDLRKVLKFKYLTLEHTGYISLWKNRPKYSEDFTGSGKTWRRGDDHICGLCAYLFPDSIDVELDLEEYEDADGNIDYSKCIVEVE